MKHFLWISWGPWGGDRGADIYHLVWNGKGLFMISKSFKSGAIVPRRPAIKQRESGFVWSKRLPIKYNKWNDAWVKEALWCILDVVVLRTRNSVGVSVLLGSIPDVFSSMIGEILRRIFLLLLPMPESRLLLAEGGSFSVAVHILLNKFLSSQC